MTSSKRSYLALLSFRLNSLSANALDERFFRAGSAHAAAGHGADEFVAHLVLLGAARAPLAPTCSGGGFLREFNRPQDPP